MSDTRVVPPAATRYAGVTFSPDGSYIYCVRRDEAEHTLASLYRAPVLGGTPQLLIKDVDSPISFSPDGKNFVYMRERHDTPFWDLLVAHSDGSPDRTLFSNASLASNSFEPVWSPSGKTIAIPVFQPNPDALSGLQIVDVATGKQRAAAFSSERLYFGGVWLPDGTGLVLATVSQMTSLHAQLSLVSYPDGEFRQLTTDTNDYFHPSISADGRSIVVSQVHRHSDLGIAPANSPDAVQPVPLASRRDFWRWDWTADGRLVIPQTPDVRMVNPAGGETVLLSDAQHVTDQVTSCGTKYFVFRSAGRSGKIAQNLWRMDADGTNFKQLTFGPNESEPECSRDGQWVLFIDRGDNRALKRVPIDGGEPETLIKDPPGGWALSPDGKRIVGTEVRELDHRLVLAVYSINDKKTDFHDVDQRASPPLSFTPDPKAVVYTVRDKGVDNLWQQALDNSQPPKQLTHFTAEQMQMFRFSPDGSKLAIERGHVESDAVLLRDTPQ
jgi:Tol biopolymer transport system component